MSLKSEWQASALPSYKFSSFTVGVDLSPFLDWWIQNRENLKTESESTPGLGCNWYYSEPDINNLVRVQVRNEFFYAPQQIAEQHQAAVAQGGTRWQEVLQRYSNVIRSFD
ncbi:hypothetical protein Lepto7375DRAFT_2312 [Leptolyngbya sp. PCC 7375]|nr:hypothetical protein Lepto7375DRAFT_2312 [Leptolyngbya sp. PCC 7375]